MWTTYTARTGTTGEVVLVSRATGANGAGPARISSDPRISGDGNLVAFVTDAGLDPADADGEKDVYIRDISAGTTTLVTPNTVEKVDRYDLSADGQYIAFRTADSFTPGDANTTTDIYRRNLGTGATNLVSRTPAPIAASGGGSAGDVSISGDGRWVAFASSSTTLVPGFANLNGADSDIFARDMQAGTTYLVSKQFNVASAGANGESYEPRIAGTPALVGDVKIAFVSRATNLSDAGVSDTSSATSVYLRSLSVNASVLISRNSSGVNADSRAHSPSISDDGSLVNFASDAQNLGPDPDYYAAYLRNVNTATTSQISADNEYAVEGDISGDGSFVTWVENGGATPDSDPDIYNVFGRPAPGGPIELVSRPPGSGAFLLPAANDYNYQDYTRRISADGRYIVFASDSQPSCRIERRQADLPPGHGDRRDRTGFPGQRSRRGDFRIRRRGRVDQCGRQPGGLYFRRTARSCRLGYVQSDLPAGPGYEGHLPGLQAERGRGCRGGQRLLRDEHQRRRQPGRLRVGSRQPRSSRGLRPGLRQGHRHGSDDHRFQGSRRRRSDRRRRIGAGQAERDGRRLAFLSRAIQPEPRRRRQQPRRLLPGPGTGETLLISRQSGLAGTPATGFTCEPAISADGNVVAFQTEDQTTAPEAGAWPPGVAQIVARNVASGQNTLVSRAPGGAAANSRADSPSLSADGSVVSFETQADNLVAGLGGESRGAVFVRDMATGVLSGPPAFGLSTTSPSRVPGCRP